MIGLTLSVNYLESDSASGSLGSMKLAITDYKGLPRNKLSILWGGQHERPKSRTGGDTHPTRKFGMFFYLEVPNLSNPDNSCVAAACHRHRTHLELPF
jgi:hypothetical protein